MKGLTRGPHLTPLPATILGAQSGVCCAEFVL